VSSTSPSHRKLLACLSRRPSSRRIRAKRSREGVPAFCTIPIIHSVQYIFAMFRTRPMNGPLEYVGQYGWFNPSWARRPHDLAQSGCPYIHGVLDVLYDTYNTFCTIHIRNIQTLRMGLIEGGELHRNQDLDHTIKPCHWSRRHVTGRDPLRHTFDPLIEGSSWSKRLYMEIRWLGEVELTFNPSF
jgi:hypothetical protein